MSAIDDAMTATYRVQGRTCTMDKYVATLPADMAADFLARVYNPKVNMANLSRAMTLLGYPVTVDVISRHRDGICETCKLAGRS